MGPVNILLDTHALLWWLFDDPKLSRKARGVIADPKSIVHVSAASAWEIATKHRKGKLPHAGDVPRRLDEYIRSARMIPLPITVPHAIAAGALPGPHNDPFDRMLVAQSLAERLPIVSIDPVFRDYGARVIW